MSWKFIKLSKDVSQKRCQEFLDDENIISLMTLYWIQKTISNGVITLKLYPYKDVNLDDAEREAAALILLLHLEPLQVDLHDISD